MSDGDRRKIEIKVIGEDDRDRQSWGAEILNRNS